MKKKGTLLLLLGAFALPVILAKLVLDLNWYQGGVTNRGQLLSTPVTSAWLGERQQWQLIYLLPEACEAKCQGALFNLQQIPLAIGAEKDRVSSVLLRATPDARYAPTVEKQLQALPQQVVSAQVISQMQTLEYGAQAIYLADPHGNVMLAYPLVTGEAAILAQGKDVLRDLKRLLKISKIG